MHGGAGGPGVSGGGPGGSRGGPGGVQRFWAENEKTRKTPRNIQDFVQEVPVGQMAQGVPPCRGPPPPNIKV